MTSSSQKLHPEHTALSKIPEELRSTIATAAPAFMESGKFLQLVHNEGQDLANLMAQVTSQLDGGASSVSSRLADTNASCTKLLDGCGQTLSANDQNALYFRSCLKDLAEQFFQGRKNAQFLLVVAKNIKIEGTRIKGVDTGMFDITADETKQFSNEMKELCTDSLEVVKRTAQIWDGLVRNLSDGQTQVSMLDSQAPLLLAETSDAMNRLIDDARQINSGVDSQLNNMLQMSGNLVMAMQFDDSLAQRIDHAAEAVKEALDAIESENPQEIAHALSSMQIQAAQIEEAAVDTRHHYTENSEYFSVLNRSFGDLLSAFENPEISSPEKSRVSQSAFVSIESGFGQILDLSGSGLKLLESVNQIGLEAQGLVDQVAETVTAMQEIGSDGHILGINAIIMTHRLDLEQQGALNALAVQINDSSGTILKIADKVKQIFEEMKGVLDGLHTSQGNQELGTELSDAVEQLRQSWQEYQVQTGRLHQRADKAIQRFKGKKASFDFLPALADALDTHAASLKQHIAGITESLPEETRALISFESFSDKRYSMDRERQIHHKIAGTEWTADDVELFDEPAKKPEESDTEFGDNVELF